jgi:hypothetical protein
VTVQADEIRAEGRGAGDILERGIGEIAELSMG